ncbi:uncharacterized protein AMSG_11876 [Thecamonas trahens ATCC 50062]|uniref:Uncharacterized protein n=1 Tax=Thecamonas trahens ATCC 50062 TaxID=461836 RepID=A0A0L0DB68_THETB|nr:hypothetical protein AMSG_11876 [Thecamonas trahens ATCC 50062]KNC49356.1 hypothetical protein AMSG_11876 [Thecamonas trahens ATCC 50062]|eukprot:XP_013757917.1 hypothetical protein AMSG_11876 [Thecamonas trahens ATCC 50062]
MVKLYVGQACAAWVLEKARSDSLCRIMGRTRRMFVSNMASLLCLFALPRTAIAHCCACLSTDAAAVASTVSPVESVGDLELAEQGFRWRRVSAQTWQTRRKI